MPRFRLFSPLLFAYAMLFRYFLFAISLFSLLITLHFDDITELFLDAIFAISFADMRRFDYITPLLLLHFRHFDSHYFSCIHFDYFLADCRFRYAAFRFSHFFTFSLFISFSISPLLDAIIDCCFRYVFFISLTTLSPIIFIFSMPSHLPFLALRHFRHFTLAVDERHCHALLLLLFVFALFAVLMAILLFRFRHCFTLHFDISPLSPLRFTSFIILFSRRFFHDMPAIDHFAFDIIDFHYSPLFSLF